MPGPFATANSWYCEGCGKTHPLSRDIEGDNFGRLWCAASIVRGIETGRNDLPPQVDHFRRQMKIQASSK